MTNISEHDSKEEGERDAGEECRIHLLVLGHIKQVNDHLERPSELIGYYVRRWADILPVVLWI